MTLLRKLVTLIACLALIGGALILWSAHKKKALAQKLAEDARVCRVQAEQGDAKAQFKLGQMYYHGTGVPQDYAEALRWISKAAEQGDARAQYDVGYMYQNAQGVPQNSAEAARWARLAADQGFAKAEAALGNEYYYGQGVPQDYGEAVRWSRKAADQGDAYAQDALGLAYYRGSGVPQDYLEAVFWFRKAAEQGYAPAQYDLGTMFHGGWGVPQDYGEAARWYRKAANQGDDFARRALGSMNRRSSTVAKIQLVSVFIGSISFLIGSFGKIRDPQQRHLTLTGLIGLSWGGLDIYGFSHVGLLLSLSAFGTFLFGKGVLAGTFLAMLLVVLHPRSPRIVLIVSATLFIALNIFWIAFYGLSRFPPAIPACDSVEGWLIGTAITSAILFWLRTGHENGNPADVHPSQP